MEDSPAKRRKTSPTTSLPINAPTTPSRIPVPRKDGDKIPTNRPSFASPTKASIARHNPQLLNRPSSSGAGAEKPNGKGKLDDLFAKYLGESPVENEALGTNEEPRRPVSQGTIGQERDEATQETLRPVTPKGKSVGVTGKPRRRSQSPIKSPVKRQNFTASTNVPEIYRGELPDNPFVKKGGLRRSPTSSQVDTIPNSNLSQEIPNDVNPFQKRTGLRRSPISLQPVALSQQAEVEKEPSQVQSQPETPPMPKPPLRKLPVNLEAPTMLEASIAQIGSFPGMSPVRKGALRRTPPGAVASQPLELPANDDNSQDEDEQVANELERPKQGARRSPVLPSSPPLESTTPKEPENPISLRRGLRRTPPGAASETPVTAKEPSASPAENENRYEQPLKSRLRSSPNNSLQPVSAPETTTASQEKQPEVTSFRKSALRRTPPAVEASVATKTVERGGNSPEQAPPEPRTTRKGALRRSSPVVLANDSGSSNLQAPNSQNESTTPTAPVPAFARTSLGAIADDIAAPQSEESAISLPAKKDVFSNIQRQAKPVVPLEFPKNVEIPQPADMIELGRPSRPGFHGEPELPPTPTQQGMDDPVVTTPPAGIHNTPSKRGRRNAALGEKLRSSPLKPRSQPTEPSQEVIPDSQPEIVSRPKPKSEKPAKRRKSARFTVPEDPHAEKKKARDALLKQLQELQADVALANQENERLRVHQQAGKRRAPVAPNPEELLALLMRSTQQPAKPEPKPASIFKSINSFLPFSSRRKTKTISLSDLEKPLPSHLPTHQDDPLPFLQAFSPLQFTSTITLEPEEPTLQNYVIHASHPSGLFAARIDMVVDSESLSIKQLEVPKLDPSSEKELGPFVREKAGGEGSLSKNLGVICWAMGRWTEVAVKRARFWCEVQSQLGNSEARAKCLKTLKAGRKRKRRAIVVEEEEEGSDDGKTVGVWTRKQLLLHMGRASMVLVCEDAEVLVEWKIGFDWTGEAESVVEACARVPRSCMYHFPPSIWLCYLR